MADGGELVINTPRWALPLLKPARYKGAKGGRGSGKSHFFAELLVEEAIADADLHAVCIREVQKSLKFSAKKLIETKIQAFGVGHLFEVQETQIKRVGGDGVIIFQGMQDHTAESIKSLEGFRIAWVEEAQSLSARSLELLLPTIRDDSSEIWFSWNPDQPTDPVDRLMCGDQQDPDSVVVHVTLWENPFRTQVLVDEAEKHRRRDPDTFPHVWLGEYKEISDAQVLNGKWRVAEFEPVTEGPVRQQWDGPYHGLDFGFANDPTAAVRLWIHDETLYVEREAGKVKLELDDTARYVEQGIPGISEYVVRADSARPESVSHLRKHGLPRCESAKKWPGSVEDGIAYLRSFKEIVIHPRCGQVQNEARNYNHKIDKQTGEVQPQIVDAYNHFIDAIRYALWPLIKPNMNKAGTW